MAPEVVKGGSRGHDKVCEFYHLNPLSPCCEKQKNIRFHPDDNEINKTIQSSSCMKICSVAITICSYPIKAVP